MHRLDLRYLVLWLFLFGIIVIVFLQVISGYNIRRLSEGNKNLLQELQVQNSLHKLEADILTVESDIRAAVLTENVSHIKNLGRNNLMVDTELKDLRENFKSSTASNELAVLQRLAREKKEFNQQILYSFF